MPGQRWDPSQVTIKGFRAGVTREQIETQLGPGSALPDSRGWSWTPPQPPLKPGGPLPVITFEMLTLEKSGNRWYLSGSQFEYGGQKLVTQIHSGDSIRQGKVQYHFGPGTPAPDGTEIAYQFPTDKRTELTFSINVVDEFGPPSSRAVTGTTISWPATYSSPTAPEIKNHARQ